MPLDDTIASLITRLMAAVCFEDAATATLTIMLGAAETALAADLQPARGRLLRGVIHLRPEGSYQRLFGLEHPDGSPVEGTGYLTSANVWRWTVEHRCSVSIDVQLGSLHPWLSDGPIHRGDAPGAAGLPGHETRERMLGRSATHVHVVPLRAPGGEVNGMITLEASCKAAMGHQRLWGACHEQLELLASIAAPYLGALRPQPVASTAPDDFLPVIGPSTAGLIELLRVFACQEETVLISGPTGSGKSRLARWCHQHSSRREQPFETLDLLSVPEDLQMAELFGWRRGAFTGALNDTPGAITRAAGGTLFIDEIDKLSLKAQAGLLRVLEERRFRMLGDKSGERHADVRFLIGTNADLRAAVHAGHFREDLYYRINVLPVRLPPLAERLDELPLWADHMLQRRHREAGAEGPARLTSEAIKRLLGMSWPGNLRQLDNIIRRAYALALAGAREPGRELVIEQHHTERALSYERAPDMGQLTTLLWTAAQAFAREAARPRDGEAVLSLELAEAFRGMVLGAAAQLLGDRDEAFARLGQTQTLRNRNQQRTLRREFDRVRELLAVLGGQANSELVAMLDEFTEPAAAAAADREALSG